MPPFRRCSASAGRDRASCGGSTARPTGRYRPVRGRSSTAAPACRRTGAASRTQFSRERPPQMTGVPSPRTNPCLTWTAPVTMDGRSWNSAGHASPIKPARIEVWGYRLGLSAIILLSKMDGFHLSGNPFIQGTIKRRAAVDGGLTASPSFPKAVATKDRTAV